MAHGRLQNNQSANGVVFELYPHGHNGKWAEKLLYDFCGLSCGDGGESQGKLFIDAAGNLYGVSEFDVLFKLTRSGSNYTESVLYTFCRLSDCADGDLPFAGPVMDSSGNLFGTTWYGGGNDDVVQEGAGTVYEFNGSWNVLHSFCAEPECTDGVNPGGKLMIDGSGNIFGTTSAYGQNNGGTVFELMP